MGISRAPSSYEDTIKLGISAVAALAMAAVIWMLTANSNARIPAKEALGQASGQVYAVCGKKTGLEFRLRGSPETFNYPSVARDHESVAAGLHAAGEREVTVLFQTGGYGPAAVWELSVDGKPIRSFAQIEEDRRANNGIGRWMSIVTLAGGIHLALLAWRGRPRRHGASAVGAKR